MKEGWCFKCRKTGHWANKCPEEAHKCPEEAHKCPEEAHKCPEEAHKCPEEAQDKKKKREEPKKNMNSKEFYTHVQAIFKDLEEDEKDKFLEEAQNAGF